MMTGKANITLPQRHFRKSFVVTIILSAALLLSHTSSAQSETEQEKVTAHLLGIGSSSILDTYLSQERFKGTGLSYLYIKEWNNWMLQHEANFSTTHDRSTRAKELEGCYSIYWGKYYAWQLPHQWKIQVGALLNGNLGFIYNTMNANNPAQARLSLNMMPSVVIRKSLQLFKQLFHLRYEADLPLLGLMFSPNYGQSYYEIFSRGNYDHNIVPTTFISAPNFRQQFSIDWQAGHSWALRIGYLGNYQQAKVNNLKQHILSNRLMIGIVITK
ncbi:MAG: DUF3316 domain-containing protein [Prevotella sp.]|nr:DUF3316 domain-containing protein [Prevotella sp.]